MRIVAALCLIGCVFPAATLAADAPYDPHTVIVRYADGASAAERAAAAARAGIVERIGAIAGVGADVVRVDGDPADAARVLAGEPAVRYAEPNWIMRTAQTPDDAYYHVQDNLHNTGQRSGTVDADIDAPEGWGSQQRLIGFPSATSGVTVGIVDRDVELAAPGVSIPSAMNDGGYILLSGTSMAVPHVSGAAALIAAAGGTPGDWRSKLSRSVDDLGVGSRDRYFGFGRINLAKALAADVQSGGGGGPPKRPAM